MKTKKAADIIFSVFFTVMLLLTLFAKDLYYLTLPKVVTEAVERKGFPDGTVEIWRCIDDGRGWCVYQPSGCL